MHRKITFLGRTHRVQLSIIDLTGEEVPPAIRAGRPQFCVTTLPNTANVYTSFSVAGRTTYCGDDPDVAWDKVQQVVPSLYHKMPAKLRRYMLSWAKGEK